MNQRDCKRDKEILSALHTGDWTADLRKHVVSCASCSELVLVAGLLWSDAIRLQPNLPDGRVIWWKGQLAKRRRSVRRITRFIGLSELLAVVVALAAVFVLLFSARHPFLRNEYLPDRVGSVLLGILITTSFLLFLNLAYLSWKKE